MKRCSDQPYTKTNRTEELLLGAGCFCQFIVLQYSLRKILIAFSLYLLTSYQ